MAVAFLAAVVRGLFLIRPLSPDESGYSIVAGQWGPGPSLYGRYWVDWPPLLLELFRVASHLGTPVGLRLMGCLAALFATLFVGLGVRQVACARASFWAAVVAALGLTSPALGALPVDGELLAAPFIAGSIWCWLEMGHRTARASTALALCSGAAAASAVLVKQNMIDAVVFFCVSVVLALVRGRPRRSFASAVAGWVAGAAVAISSVLGLAIARGSSLGGIWYAMYPFRLEAVNPIIGASRQDHLAALGRLGGLESLTLGPVALATLGVLVFRRGASRTMDLGIVAPAVLAVAAYDVFSIAEGGSYWGHYLVQLVVPTALAMGIVAGRGTLARERLTAAVVTLSLGLWIGGLTHLRNEPGPSIGAAIASVSKPGDTIVSAFGNADIVETSGLRSDYPYLWSLLARTRDKHFGSLAALLNGPRAPTWLVVRGHRTESRLLAGATRTVLRSHYHVVRSACGRVIFLNDAVHRHAPPGSTTCRSS